MVAHVMLLLVLTSHKVAAFTVPTPTHPAVSATPFPRSTSTNRLQPSTESLFHLHRHGESTRLLGSAKGSHDAPNEEEEEEEKEESQLRRRQPFGLAVKLPSLRRWRRLARVTTAALATLGMAHTRIGGTSTTSLIVPPAHASAPVMALPKAEGRDPSSEALLQHEKQMRAEAQQELADMSKKAREIEATHGEKARVKFEREFKEQQQRRATEKAEGLVQLQRNLLDQGIDPFVDLEGQRQMAFYERGVDLGDVPGTPFHLDKEFEKTNYKKSMAFQKAYHRQCIACMVQDLKNRGLDPLEYFTAHQSRTETLLNLPLLQAKALAEQYSANLELYGQINPPKEGEISALERMKQESNNPATQKAAKAAAREAAQRQKAEAKAQAAELRQLQKEEREQQKQREIEARQQAQAQAATAAQQATMQALRDAAAAAVEGTEESGAGEPAAFDLSAPVIPPPTARSSASPLPILPVSAFVVAAGGGGYAFKVYREKAARDEEERRRQIQLLMGGGDRSSSSNARRGDGITNGANGDSRSTSSALLDDTSVDTRAIDAPPSTTPPPKLEQPEPTPVAPKKKRRGLGVFSRRKNEREVDLTALVTDGARAPEFALLLAKILTFGAPGRFPSVVALPGGMPLDTFDLEAAQQLLVDSRIAAGLELEESAEVFADVVNCMLINIVDLASASLKEDEKTTIAAIDIVVDFMQHAASLYDSVAGKVVISPVTYGGTMSKAKLEQMYSTYAGSVMSSAVNTRDDFDDRVRLLQDVFQISDKKAEGLMLKVMQKNMMEMLKSGEGMEGMQEMLAGMGGMEGMPDGMPGMEGGEPSPEQVKEMLLALKAMKDSGSFSKEDLDKIKKEFKASFGDSVDNLTSGDPLDATEQELLDLMKSILDEK